MNAVINVYEVLSAETLPMRTHVLRPGREPSEGLFSGEMPESARHFAAFEDEKIVGVGYIVPAPAPFDSEPSAWQLRGMSVEPTRQGQGIGALIVRHVEAEAKRANIEIVWFNARSAAVAFYAKLGFELRGEEFEIPTVGPHFLMSKHIKP